MRIAIAGLGGAGSRGHLPAITRLEQTGQARLVAVAEPDEGRRAAVLERRPDVIGFARTEDLLADARCDVLVIATEPERHATLAALALERGTHVICEKPLALTADHIDTVAAAAARSPSRAPALVPVHQYRYSPSWAQVSRWARLAARRRQPFSIVANVERAGTDGHAATSWRDDTARAGGMLADAGVHFLALAWTVDPRLTVLGGARLREGRDERSFGLVGVGSGLFATRVRTGAAARRTHLQVCAEGTVATWTDDRLTIDVAGLPLVRRTVPALSDRAHVNALYSALYDDVAQHLANPRWRRHRTAEGFAVGRALAALLAQAPVTNAERNAA